MQSIRAAAVSMNSVLGREADTLAQMRAYCEQTVRDGAQLVLFPELVAHGHCNPQTWEVAEPVPGGATTETISQWAREFNVVISVGLCEKENDIVYNTQLIAGPDGYIGKQRKLHMSRDESFFYKGGRDICVFDVGKCKVATVICYDNQFPEIARIAALRGADVILMPHAARQGRWQDAASETAARQKVFDLFSSSYRMRARENACFCVYADQAGSAGVVSSLPSEHYNQPNHPGGAMIIDPLGDIVAHAQIEKIQDEIVIADLDAEVLARARSHPNYTLRTRRPELFAELAREQVSS
ncbi:MAG: nitrilase-related carbon-nitrogen hydrolase [Pirellulaceae bacterium]|nr:nitrilase-related carbon-nitrogen hydrolase [Pirellulaceae bacterium]MDP7015428.1 nitrilase-related carbon-nitrogen hydrolase [Pirellulaceae bacterium]